MLETIRTCGLDRTWHEVLLPWHQPTAVHDSAKALLDLALSLAFGGDCLADIAVLRAEPGLYGPVASDPTSPERSTRSPLTRRGPWRRQRRAGGGPRPGLAARRTARV